MASEYARGQLLSAFSISRHLTVELEHYDREIQTFGRDVCAITRSGAADLAGSEDLLELASRLEQATQARAAGDLLADLLGRLRDDESDAAALLRVRIHSRMRALFEREVALLADVIEGQRPS
jgi:hypothetical protein